MRKVSKSMLIIKIIVGLTIIVGLFYSLFIYSNIPLFKDMRNIWIETAMTTAEHQWLATKFIPSSVINKVMEDKKEDFGQIGVTNINQNNRFYKKETGLLSKDLNYKLDNESESEEKNNLIEFEDSDPFGNKVVINDKEQGIKIVEIKTLSYTGKLVFIDDPSRVFVSHTDTKGKKGKLILDFLKDNNAIIGINANGFEDYEGKGLGGKIMGFSMSSGELWGNGTFSTLTTIGFNTNDELIVGKMEDASKYNLRDMVQFKPILILNGEIFIEGTAGWGVQPRTIVAQREDGVVMFLVVDGRKPGYSIGITMGEAAELLHKYDAVTAAACDGGSSSVLAYNGEIINKPSTPMTTGRYLPNAILVKSK